MRRLHAGVTLVGFCALLVSLGAPWWNVSLESGVIIPVSGVGASPLASSLLAVGAAALGLTFVLRGPWRRLVSILQGISCAGAAYAVYALSGRPEVAVVSEIGSLTGVTGASALDAVVGAQATAFLWVGVLGITASILSGALGAVVPDRATTTDRFQRSAEMADPKDSVAAWDDLSEGSDPTTR